MSRAVWEKDTAAQRSADRRTPQKRGRLSSPAVSVIVPTYDEAANIVILVERLEKVLVSYGYEIIVVDDDSADRTWEIAEGLAEKDHRITVIRRTSQRGLSSAVLAGMAAARGNTMVVIDADLQHDERRIPDLLSALASGADVCLGSRDAEGGDYGTFKRRRRLASWVGARLARIVLRVPVSDPMSGFFAISAHRYRLVESEVNPRGFKIMLEFLARGPKPVVAEVGYVFGERVNGKTKLTGAVMIDYIRALFELRFSSWRR